MTSRRAYLGTLALLAAGGGLALFASSRPWGTATLPSALSVTETTVSGGDLLPFAPAVSLVALAAVVAVPAVRRLGRRVVGGVLALAGAALAVVAELTVLDLEDRVAEWVASSPGAAGSAESVSTAPGWGLATAAGGVLVLLAGLVIAVRGPSWPAMGAKYDRPERRRPAPREAGARETWDALSRGDDPT